MNFTLRRASVVTSALISSLTMTCAIALADPHPADFPVQVISQPSAPVALGSCKAQIGYMLGGINITAGVQNKTRHELLSLTLRFQEFDTENTLIGGGDSTIDNVDPPLVGGDTNAYTLGVKEPKAESLSAMGHMTCRVQHAEFTGRRSWTYGQPWPEPLASPDSE